jgi:hypothetical protein
MGGVLVVAIESQTKIGTVGAASKVSIMEFSVEQFVRFILVVKFT